MPPTVRVTGTIVRDKDHGYKRLVENLGGLGAITLGVQGADATLSHPESELTVGEVAAIHELGIGVPERSWLRKWMDHNQTLMMQDVRRELVLIAEGKTKRKQAFERLGYKWTVDIRDNIYQGKITPPLSAGYRNRTGVPLFDSGFMASKITYVVYLEPKLRRNGRFASEKQVAVDAVGGPGAFADTIPSIGASFPKGPGAAPGGTVRVPNSTQPPARPVTVALPGTKGAKRVPRQGPRLPQHMGGGFYSKRARRFGPRQARVHGPRLPKGFRRIRAGHGGVMAIRRGKSISLLQWLIRKAMKLARKGNTGDFRNHGFTGSGRGGRTGRRGFKK